MSVKTCKDNLFYPMSGTKIFFNGAWHTIKDLDRIYFGGKWYRINHDIHPLNRVRKKMPICLYMPAMFL